MRVLDATGNGEVVMWEIHEGDNQMWYWEGDVLKNKAYSDKVKPFIHAGNHAKIQQMAPKNHKADCRHL